MKKINKNLAWSFLLLLSLISCGRVMEKEVGKGTIDDVVEQVEDESEWSASKKRYVANQLQIEYRLANLANQAGLKSIHLPTYQVRAMSLAKEYDSLNDLPNTIHAGTTLYSELIKRDSLSIQGLPEKEL